MQISLLRLFIIFIKVGAILLGGGYVVLPILKNEFNEKRNLIAEEELVNYFALSQSMPGIIAANMSMFIGYKLKRKLGAVTAITGIIFVPFWTIILLASILGTLANNTYIRSAFWGVSIAVVALITLTIKEMWKKSTKNFFFYFIFIFSLIALLWLHLSPINVILIFSLIGIAIKFLWRKAA